MAGAGQHRCGGFGDIVEIDETEPRFDRVRHTIDAGAYHAIPFGKDVLHIGGGLQDGDVERRAEQHLLDPQLVPVMRHRLDLRVQDRMIDQARHAGAFRCIDNTFRKRYFMRTDVRADVIDRFRSPGCFG